MTSGSGATRTRRVCRRGAGVRAVARGFRRGRAAAARRQIATKLFSRLAIFARDICRPLRSDSPQIGFRFLPGVEIDLYVIFNSLYLRTVVAECLSSFNRAN